MENSEIRLRCLEMAREDLIQHSYTAEQLTETAEKYAAFCIGKEPELKISWDETVTTHLPTGIFKRDVAETLRDIFTDIAKDAQQSTLVLSKNQAGLKMTEEDIKGIIKTSE